MARLTSDTTLYVIQCAINVSLFSCCVALIDELSYNLCYYWDRMHNIREL